jgi:uncharacterized protein (TIGR02594 family)
VFLSIPYEININHFKTNVNHYFHKIINSFMKKLCVIYLILTISGCSIAPDRLDSRSEDVVETAGMMLGLHERRDRAELASLMGVDPVRTEWCAAFVNMILDLHGIQGSETVSPNPLLARSFLRWGQPVEKENITRGDIVVFPRGNQGWQGHVGFYVETIIIDGVVHYAILGGNQDDNSVSVDLYPARRAIGIRRQTSA